MSNQDWNKVADNEVRQGQGPQNTHAWEAANREAYEAARKQAEDRQRQQQQK